ncbi:MAG: peptidoglycan-binding protein [Acidobacteria bacterium]|nr:peptidoglycan-binding protein [Acidobacteriota bacterium]
MRKIVALFSAGAILVLLAISGIAQTATVEETPTQWRISEKEVVAVQTELKRRGYYNAKPNGVLDRTTREAVKEYQSENGLKVTGRIDRATYEKLELPYPATGKERDNERRSGILPAIGYGIKDKTVSTGKAMGNTANKVKDKTEAGYDKTKAAGSGAVSKTKEVAQDVGDTTKKGAKTVERGTQAASDTVVGRSDADIQSDLRELLSENPETEKWYSEVKSGQVTIKTPPQHKVDVGPVISSIRKISGVKSVFVIAE